MAARETNKTLAKRIFNRQGKGDFDAQIAQAITDGVVPNDLPFSSLRSIKAELKHLLNQQQAELTLSIPLELPDAEEVTPQRKMNARPKLGFEPEVIDKTNGKNRISKKEKHHLEDTGRGYYVNGEFVIRDEPAK